MSSILTIFSRHLSFKMWLKSAWAEVTNDFKGQKQSQEPTSTFFQDHRLQAERGLRDRLPRHRQRLEGQPTFFCPELLKPKSELSEQQHCVIKTAVLRRVFCSVKSCKGIFSVCLVTGNSGSINVFAEVCSCYRFNPSC